MNAVLQLYRLIRPFNVVLIALTPAAIWASLVRPLLAQPLLDLQLTVLLGLMMAAIAAAGNVVNDIADRTIDRLNERPNPLLEGMEVQLAWGLVAGFALAGIGLGWHLWTVLGTPLYLGLVVCASLALVGYAFSLKCKPLVGNLLVSGLCAIVPGIVLLAEPIILASADRSPLSQTLVAYTVMAFFGTLARELVKDLEDSGGDAAAGCRTLAVRWPRAATVRLIQVCLAVVLAAVIYVATIWYMTGMIMNVLSWCALWLLLASILYSIRPTLSKADFGQVSRHIKLSMAFGLFLLILVSASPWN